MYKITIVEDRKEIAKSIGRRLDESPNLKLSGVYHTAEIALAEIPTTLTDIVLMDIGLPRMNGIECMIRLRDKMPNLKFLMFTVFDEDDKLFEALKSGAKGYILKSDGIRGAIQAIEELILGGAPMSREIARKVLFHFQAFSIEKKPIDLLTNRQNEILHHLADGLQNKEIADRLEIKEGTVKQHVHSIYQTLEVNNRVEARNKYINREE